MKNDKFSEIEIPEVVREIEFLSNENISSLSDFIKRLEKQEVQWHKVEEWESLDDVEILELLVNVVAPIGMLSVVCESSHNVGGAAYRLNSVDLMEFVSTHIAVFGECFFNGDVLITSPTQKLIWFFHHEGVFAVVSLLKMQ